MLQVVLIAILVLALFPAVRRRVEKAVGRVFAVLLFGAVAFLAVVVLTH